MPAFIEMFLIPIRDNVAAQVMVEAVVLLSGLDILMGVGSAWFVSHDYSSARLRVGIIKKMQNLAVVAACSVLDTALLVGIDLGTVLPFTIPGGSIVVTAATAFVAMEVSSIMEIYAKSHPELTTAEWYQMLTHGKVGTDAAPIEAQNVTITTKIVNSTADPDDTLDLGRLRGE